MNFGGISVGGIVGNRKLYGQGIDADHLPHTQQALRDPAQAFTRGMAPTGGVALANGPVSYTHLTLPTSDLV